MSVGSVKISKTQRRALWVLLFWLPLLQLIVYKFLVRYA